MSHVSTPETPDPDAARKLAKTRTLRMAYGGEFPDPVPPSVDLRDRMPPVLDQGDLGSSTAHAVADAASVIPEGEPLTPSRVFLYEGATPVEPGMTFNPKFDPELLHEQMTATGRRPSEPEMQFLTLDGGARELEQEWRGTRKAMSEVLSLKHLADLDYTKLEQRVAAHMAKRPDEDPSKNLVTDEQPPETVGVTGSSTAFLIQAEAAEQMMQTRQATLMAQLQALAEKWGLQVSSTDGQILVHFPGNLSPEQREEAARQLIEASMGVSYDQELPGLDLGHGVYTLSTSSDDPLPRLPRIAEIGRIGRIGRSGKSNLLLATMMAQFGGSFIGAPVRESQAAPQPPADRHNGQIGRVSPDLAYKLGKAGFQVNQGDMLCWLVNDVVGDQELMQFSIFAVAPGARLGPIPLALLPHKVQKRAVVARPR